VPALSRFDLKPHPDQSTSADPLLRTAGAAAGVLNVPARSVAVFVADL
jgi:pullulanase